MDYLNIIQLAAKGIFIPNYQGADAIAARLSQIGVEALIELASDYKKNRSRLSIRSRAVMARTIFELAIRLSGILKSVEIALSIAHSDYDADLKRYARLSAMDSGNFEQLPAIEHTLRENILFIKSYLPNPRNYSVFELAKEVGLESFYRSHYFELSRYVHGNHTVISQNDDWSIVTMIDDLIVMSCCEVARLVANRFSHTDREKISFAINRAVMNFRNK